MVAYSFKKQFVERIERQEKRQTMRNDRARHTRPGEEVQLYYAMRTKQCRLLGRAICSRVAPVRINFKKATIRIGHANLLRGIHRLDDFARCDGFESWGDLVAFWNKEHDAIERWEGVLIEWNAFQAP